MSFDNNSFDTNSFSVTSWLFDEVVAPVYRFTRKVLREVLRPVLRVADKGRYE